MISGNGSLITTQFNDIPISVALSGSGFLSLVITKDEPVPLSITARGGLDTNWLGEPANTNLIDVIYGDSDYTRVYKDNSYSITYEVRNSDDTIKDLTGTSELEFHLAKRKNRTPILSYTLASAELSIIDPTNGLIQVLVPDINIQDIEEGLYFQDLWQRDLFGDPITIVSDRFYIINRSNI